MRVLGGARRFYTDDPWGIREFNKPTSYESV